MNCGFFISIFLLISASLFGQPDRFHEDISHSLKQDPTGWINIHTSNSFISKTPVQIRTVKGGLSFNDKIRFGLGYNWLGNEVTYQLNDAQKSHYLKMNYISLNADYRFHRSGNWSFTIPVQLGLGVSYGLENESDSFKDRRHSSTVFLYEPHMLAQYHFLNYFSISGGLGFRWMILRNRNLGGGQTAPVFILRFQIDFRKLVKDSKER